MAHGWQGQRTIENNEQPVPSADDVGLMFSLLKVFVPVVVVVVCVVDGSGTHTTISLVTIGD